MISRIIIVQHKFGLTTPKTQRMLAAAKAYIHNGIEVFFIYSSKNEEHPEFLYPNIHFSRIREDGRIDFRCYRRFYKLIKSLYTEDSVILFYDVPYYSFLFKASKYNVFSEITEVPLFGKQASIAKRFLAWICLTAVRGFSGLFVISKSLEEYYRQRGVNNIKIINMFVDKSRFAGLRKTSDEKYIGYCGTISIHKDGVDDLIKAFSYFIKEHPDYKLYLFGRFESEVVKVTLNQLVENLGVSSKVVFTGPVDAKEMPQRLVNARILALARPANEQAQFGFPTKLGEYLATGNPVVITGVGDIPLFLKDETNAFIVAPGDYKLFAEKLCWVADHPEESARIGNAGKELVDKAFSSELQTEKAIAFIKILYQECNTKPKLLKGRFNNC